MKQSYEVMNRLYENCDIEYWVSKDKYKTHGERITDLISIYDSFVSLLIYLITFTGMHEANFYCSKVVAVLRK